MLLTIDSLLDESLLQRVHRLFDQAHFVDGKLTAGFRAREVKNNLQMDARDVHYQQLNDLILPTLTRHPDYLAACWPRKLLPPYYVRYHSSMAYGEHVDNPVMHDQDPTRTDVSMTIFLSSPERYEGGELVIQDGLTERSIKLAAGSVVLYPSTSRHFVAPVTAGERRVVVTWLQSCIRDPDQRDILYQLNQARTALQRQNPTSPALAKVNAVFNNLVRRWIVF